MEIYLVNNRNEVKPDGKLYYVTRDDSSGERLFYYDGNSVKAIKYQKSTDPNLLPNETLLNIAIQKQIGRSEKNIKKVDIEDDLINIHTVMPKAAMPKTAPGIETVNHNLDFSNIYPSDSDETTDYYNDSGYTTDESSTAKKDVNYDDIYREAAENTIPLPHGIDTAEKNKNYKEQYIGLTTSPKEDVYDKKEKNQSLTNDEYHVPHIPQHKFVK